MRKIVSVVISFMLVFSCSLDTEPISEFSASGFYKTADDARAGVYGIYNATQSAFSRNLAFWGEGRADAVDTRHSGDPRMLLNNTLNKDMTSARWSGLYQIISRANYAVKYIPEVLTDEGLGATLLGQTRGLRALAYFYAVRIWGEVPLILEPFESTEQEIFVSRDDQEKSWHRSRKTWSMRPNMPREEAKKRFFLPERLMLYWHTFPCGSMNTSRPLCMRIRCWPMVRMRWCR